MDDNDLETNNGTANNNNNKNSKFNPLKTGKNKKNESKQQKSLGSKIFGKKKKKNKKESAAKKAIKTKIKIKLFLFVVLPAIAIFMIYMSILIVLEDLDAKVSGGSQKIASIESQKQKDLAQMSEQDFEDIKNELIKQEVSDPENSIIKNITAIKAAKKKTRAELLEYVIKILKAPQENFKRIKWFVVNGGTGEKVQAQVYVSDNDGLNYPLLSELGDKTLGKAFIGNAYEAQIYEEQESGDDAVNDDVVTTGEIGEVQVSISEKVSLPSDFDFTFTTETNKIAFYKYIAAYAVRNYQINHILPSVTMGQAIFESGNGTSEFYKSAKSYYKLLKDDEWTGTVYESGDKEYKKYLYPNYSLNDYNNYLVKTDAFNSMFALTTPEAQLEVVKSGFTNSASYVEDILSIMDRYHLKEFDEYVKSTPLNIIRDGSSASGGGSYDMENGVTDEDFDELEEITWLKEYGFEQPKEGEIYSQVIDFMQNWEIPYASAITTQNVSFGEEVVKHLWHKLEVNFYMLFKYSQRIHIDLTLETHQETVVDVADCVPKVDKDGNYYCPHGYAPHTETMDHTKQIWVLTVPHKIIAQHEAYRDAEVKEKIGQKMFIYSAQTYRGILDYTIELESHKSLGITNGNIDVVGEPTENGCGAIRIDIEKWEDKVTQKDEKLTSYDVYGKTSSQFGYIYNRINNFFAQPEKEGFRLTVTNSRLNELFSVLKNAYVDPIMTIVDNKKMKELTKNINISWPAGDCKTAVYLFEDTDYSYRDKDVKLKGIIIDSNGVPNGTKGPEVKAVKRRKNRRCKDRL